MRLRPPVLLLFAITLIASCSGGGGDGGGVSLEQFPQIEVEPPEREVQIPVGALPIDARTSYTLTFRNTGEETLVVDDVALTYEAPDGVYEAEPAFALERVDSLPASLDDAALFTVEVAFVHQDRVPREARLVVDSNSRDDGRLEIVLRSYEGRPVALVSSDELDFGIVRSGDTKDVAFTLLNNGDDVLYFNGFRLGGEGAWTFRDESAGASWALSQDTEAGIVFDAPVALEPAVSRELHVSYQAVDTDAAEGLLELLTNDTSAGESLPVRLVANGRVPRITVEPTSVHFGPVGIGVKKLRAVRVTAGGTAPLEILELSLSEGSSFDFAVEYDGVAPSDEAPLFVALNDSVDIPISFVPDTQEDGPDGEPLSDAGALIIRSNAYEETVTVPLTGTGINATCPTAVIQVTEGEEVAPQTVLHLDGEASEAYCGSIDDWDWTVTPPEGSVSPFLPSPSFPTPVLAANVAGTYEFCLEVRDTCGMTSCEPACTQVIVIPNERIHVELLWSTPGDDDPTDEGPLLGADMDLHLMHPYALLGGQDIDGDGQADGWFDSTYDCFFENPEPDWGSFDPEADDNPSLDRDDTDGGGPENVNLNVPEDLSSLPPEVVADFDGGESAYHIGVHYWNDHGYGPSLATVRVYVFGDLVWERAEVLMSHRDLWRVGVIRWPEGVVQEFAGETGDPVIIEDYNHPGWMIP